jgi:hypothetical protein
VPRHGLLGLAGFVTVLGEECDRSKKEEGKRKKAAEHEKN